MNVNKEFPSKWITEPDLNGKEFVLKIHSVTTEDLGRPGSSDRKLCCWFHGTEKGLACNVVNRNTITDMYGPETDNWVGELITLYPTTTEYNGKMVPCIRVRTEVPKKGGKPKESVAALPVSEPVAVTQIHEPVDESEIPF